MRSLIPRMFQLLNPDGSVAHEYRTEYEANYAAMIMGYYCGLRFKIIPRPSDEVQAVRPQILRDDGGGVIL